MVQEAVLRPALDFRRMEVVVVVMDFERPPVEQIEEEEQTE